MNVTLTPELEKLLNEKLQAGEYRSADEVINAAMLLFRDREEDRAVVARVNNGEPLPADTRFRARLEILLEESQESGEVAEMTPDDWDDIEREGIALMNSRKRA